MSYVTDINGIGLVAVKRPVNSKITLHENRERIQAWCKLHASGKWIITPSYVYFTLSDDAVLFKLSFKL